MKITMQQGMIAAELSFAKWGVAVVGDAIDDRGGAAVEFAKTNATITQPISYNPDEFVINSNGVSYGNESLVEFIKKSGSGPLLIEATTLGFVEIYWLCKAAMESGLASIDILYVEPESYSKAPPGHLPHPRDFELSSEVELFTAVPGAALIVSVERPPKAVFLLGYEGQRFEQALESTELMPSRCCVVMGVPAFKPGWEMDTFANNVRILRDRNISREIFYGGAQNPLSVFESLQVIYKACQPDERLLVIPIGTKPHGIGAALFACENDRVALMYDNPTRKKKRSDKVGMWHLFRVEF